MTVNRDRKLHEWLRSFAILAAGYADGDLTFSHLHLTRTRLDNDRTRTALKGDQEFFVEWGRGNEFKDFKKIVDTWLIAVDVDGEEPEDQEQSTTLTFRKGTGGRLIIKGELDALSGQAFQTAVEAEAEKVRKQDLADVLERDPGQRRAVALVNLIQHGAARPDDTFSTPLINIVMSEHVAERLLANTGDDETVPVHWNDIDGRCELIDGTPIHPNHALKVFGVATLRRHVMGAKSRIIDTSYNARSFPDWIKNAVLVQSRGQCDTHGCAPPTHWLQIDHVDPRSRGGPTSFLNAQPQCRPDNQAKTNTIGHTPWRNKRPPPRYEPLDQTDRDHDDRD